jgi:ethanolamine ammonia-lyase small subunit
MNKQLIQADPSRVLKQQTNARIGLGNVGGALPTQEVLSLRLDHAAAKDAVFSPLKIELLQTELQNFNLPTFRLKSRITDKVQYLKRPDLGRRLEAESVTLLKSYSESVDIVLVITDGLSAEAVNQHAVEIIGLVVPELSKKYKLAFVLVENGRVAIADEIGELLKAKFSAIFIGERPGLSSPKSMGIYTTFNPKIGLTDESRNCISNIHSEGLNYNQATQILSFYTQESFTKAYSGFNLKLDLNKIAE